MLREKNERVSIISSDLVAFQATLDIPTFNKSEYYYTYNIHFTHLISYSYTLQLQNFSYQIIIEYIDQCLAWLTWSREPEKFKICSDNILRG